MEIGTGPDRTETVTKSEVFLNFVQRWSLMESYVLSWEQRLYNL
jgi:hypothetical protein